MSELEFDNADYYGGEDEETLEYTSPEEYIERIIEDWGKNWIKAIPEASPIFVRAYKRREIDEHWIRHQAERFSRNINEAFQEDFGDPDGDANQPDSMKFISEIADLVKRILSTGEVWQCDPIGSRKFSAEEVEKMMRENRPEEFEGFNV